MQTLALNRYLFLTRYLQPPKKTHKTVLKNFFNIFKTYTFKKPFEEYSFLEADTFDSLYKMAQEQENENLKFAEGHME